MTNSKNIIVRQYGHRALHTVYALLLMAWVGAASAAPRWTLPPAFPSQLNHGLELMREPDLQAAVIAFETAKPGTRLGIFHPKADEGVQLANQLYDWLLLTGFNPEQLELKPHKKLKNQLAIELVKP